MTQRLCFIVIFGLLVGCSSQQQLASLSEIEGLSLTQDSFGHEVIDKYKTVRPIAEIEHSLSLCIAQELDNSPVVLNNLSNSQARFYYGWPYYGFIDEFPSQQSVTTNGGETIKLIEKNQVVANAITDYVYQSFSDMKYFVGYTVTATQNKNSIHYLFSNIKQAKQYTGSVANDGFESVRTLKNTHPDLVIEALNKQVDKIQQCLVNKQSTNS